MHKSSLPTPGRVPRLKGTRVTIDRWRDPGHEDLGIMPYLELHLRLIIILVVVSPILIKFGSIIMLHVLYVERPRIEPPFYQEFWWSLNPSNISSFTITLGCLYHPEPPFAQLLYQVNLQHVSDVYHNPTRSSQISSTTDQPEPTHLLFTDGAQRDRCQCRTKLFLEISFKFEANTKTKNSWPEWIDRVVTS